MAEALAQTNFVKFPNAVNDEQEYVKFLCGAPLSAAQGKASLSAEVAKARQKINESLASASTASVSGDRVARLESENAGLKKTVQSLEARVAELEKRFAGLSAAGGDSLKAAASNGSAAAAAAADDDDDVDLFGSDDEEDAEAEKLKAERLKAYQDKKSKKPALIAKSNIILDVKPWDDETDMAEMERKVRSIQAEGLLWGSSKLVPLAYGIKKLQIACVVEDDKIGTDFLEEKITEFEDFVQSVDIAAFQKI